MTRQAARVDGLTLGLLGGFLPGYGAGRLAGRPRRARAAGGQVGALAGRGEGGGGGWWGVPGGPGLDLTMSPLPNVPSQTPFLQNRPVFLLVGTEDQPAAARLLVWWV